MKIHQLDGFEFSYVRTPKDMTGTLRPFYPHWWVQYLADGQSWRFDTKAQVLEWIELWNA